MKKYLAFFLSVVMVLSLAGCGSSNGSSGSSAAANDSNGEKKSYKLSIGHTTSSSESDPYYLTCKYFKQDVEEATKGRITVEIYSDGQMGSELEMFEGMQAGTLDMGIETNSYVGAYVPSSGCLDLPFIFKDYDQAHSILDGAFGTKLLDAMSSNGVTGLAWSEGGFRQLVTGQKAVASPADLKGMKIRSMETKTYLAAYASLGVSATPMAWSETVTALQQHVIDGLDAPISVIYANGFPDVAKYIDMVNLFYSPLVVCISNSVFDKFDADDQALLKDCAKKAGVATRNDNAKMEQQMLGEMKSKGMTIVTDVDLDAFRQEAQSCYQNQELKTYIGEDYVNELMGLVGMK